MLKDSIASRVLHCQIDGKKEEVIVRFGVPQQVEDYFTCEYEISVAGKSEAYQIIGLDSVQALQLAMFMVDSALRSVTGASDWSWNDEPHTGFPTGLDYLGSDSELDYALGTCSSGRSGNLIANDGEK
jgi:hypothetical protein